MGIGARGRSRTGATPICRAPFDSLHLDQFGEARACCQSDLVLGNAGDHELIEIWNGEKAGQLRSAVAAGDLSVGCTFCEWAVRNDEPAMAYARTFDHLRGPGPGGGPARTTGPGQFELALSNACNLQCTMCNGDFSSSIRTHRERRPPLPEIYGDRFFTELATMLEGVTKVEMLGGEPLLGKEPLRALELVAAHAPDAAVTITTNGTVWSPRVDRLLGDTECSIVVSVDGASAETYEAIRVGADWSVLLQTLGRLADLTREKGTALVLAHCLMVENWHEFPDLLALAARLDAPAFVNTVIDPPESSLYHLLPIELQHVLRCLRSRESEVVTLGDPWLTIWQRELNRLAQNLDDSLAGTVAARIGGGAYSAEPASRIARLPDPPESADQVSSLLAEHPAARVTALRFDEQFRVRKAEVVAPGAHLSAEEDLLGRRLRSVLSVPPDAPRNLLQGTDSLVDEEWLATDDRSLTTQRRIVTTGPTGDPLVLLAEQLVDDERQLVARLRSTADSGDPLVQLDIDADGIVESVSPSSEAARSIGLAVKAGDESSETEALLLPELRQDISLAVEPLDWVTNLITVSSPTGLALKIATRMRFDGSNHIGSRVFITAAEASD